MNPKAHLDPLGTIMIVIAGFGWGRPTPVSPWNLRIGEKSGMAVVSIAGPISNVIVAFLAALPFRLGLLNGSPASTEIIAPFLGALITWNLVLAAFNLLPIAPLDGFKVVLGLLPRDAALSFAKTERMGPMILMVLILSGIVLPVGILSIVIVPIINILRVLVLGY
ncbi:MAG: site-2 protease family protein [Chloroflexi bacterium]|nr:site-2 protease family protein [Chloroflexota bacterium]